MSHFVASVRKVRASRFAAKDSGNCSMRPRADSCRIEGAGYGPFISPAAHSSLPTWAASMSHAPTSAGTACYVKKRAKRDQNAKMVAFGRIKIPESAQVQQVSKLRRSSRCDMVWHASQAGCTTGTSPKWCILVHSGRASEVGIPHEARALLAA